MQYAAARIGDMGNYLKELKRLHKLIGSRSAALDTECNHARISALEILIRKLVRRVVDKTGISHPLNLIVILERKRERETVIAVSLHPKMQSLAAHIGKISIERTHAAAHISEALRSYLDYERSVAARALIYHAVVALVGRCKHRITGIARKVEMLAAYDKTAYTARVTVEILGGRVDYHVRAVLERSVQYGSGKSVVDYQQYAVLPAYGHELGVIEYFHRGIGYALAED